MKLLWLLLFLIPFTVASTVLGADTFFCPMKCEQEKIYAKPGRCPICRMKLDKVGAEGRKGMTLPEVRVDLNVLPSPKAKTPLALQLAVRQTKDNQLVKTFEVLHEKPLHLIMVSQDLSWFDHVHPTLAPTGEFKLDYTFNEPGNYVLYADFKPTGKNAEVIPLAFRVEGEAPKPVALTEDNLKTAKSVNGYDVKLTPIPSLQHGDTVKLSFYVTQNKKPVANVEPYLGAGGHLVAVSEDTTRYLHAHPADHVVHEAGGHGRAHHAPVATKYGPTLEFTTTFPRDGLYKVWLQFNHAGKIQTVPFVVRAK